MCSFVTFLAHEYLRLHVFGKHSSNDCHLGVGGACWMVTFELWRSFQHYKSHVYLCVPEWLRMYLLHVKRLTHPIGKERHVTTYYSMCETFANQWGNFNPGFGKELHMGHRMHSQICIEQERVHVLSNLYTHSQVQIHTKCIIYSFA